MTHQHDGTGVYCDDCGRNKLLIIQPDKGILVKDRRHGNHQAEIGPKVVLERLSGTLEGSAIMEWVRGVVLNSGK